MLSKARIKYIQSLHQKKFRDSEQVYIAEGPKMADEYISALVSSIVEICALESWWKRHPRFQELYPHITVQVITEEELRRISVLQHPQEVLLLVKKPANNTWVTPDSEWVLMLDGIQDPGNMGTIIRTADWFGVKQVLCSEDCADVFNPKVVQATMGSLVRMQVIELPLKEVLEKHPRIPVYAAMLEGTSMYSLFQPRPGFLLIGSEGRGIRPGLIRHIHTPVTIPGSGGAESLNAAVATGILLSHLVLPRSS